MGRQIEPRPAGGTVTVLPGWTKVRQSLPQYVRNTTNYVARKYVGPFLIDVDNRIMGHLNSTYTTALGALHSKTVSV